MDDHAWKEFRQGLPDAVDDTERKRLLQKYEALTKERLDLGRHVGVLPRAGEPVYRWTRYKEAHSPQLARDVLDELLGQPGRGDLGGGVVYDPMAGSGTSLLVAAERGLPALGADLLPYAALVSSTMVRWREADPAQVLRTGEDALSRYDSFPGDARLDVPAASWAFSLRSPGHLQGCSGCLPRHPEASSVTWCAWRCCQLLSRLATPSRTARHCDGACPAARPGRAARGSSARRWVRGT